MTEDQEREKALNPSYEELSKLDATAIAIYDKGTWTFKEENCFIMIEGTAIVTVEGNGKVHSIGGQAIAHIRGGEVMKVEGNAIVEEISGGQVGLMTNIFVDRIIGGKITSLRPRRIMGISGGHIKEMKSYVTKIKGRDENNKVIIEDLIGGFIDYIGPNVEIKKISTDEMSKPIIRFIDSKSKLSLIG